MLKTTFFFLCPHHIFIQSDALVSEFKTGILSTRSVGNQSSLLTKKTSYLTLLLKVTGFMMVFCCGQ